MSKETPFAPISPAQAAADQAPAPHPAGAREETAAPFFAADDASGADAGRERTPSGDTRYCPQCGMAAAAADAFCCGCGARLTAGDAVAAPAAGLAQSPVRRARRTPAPFAPITPVTLSTASAADVGTPSVFAAGLPAWDLVPPHTPVRRRGT